MIEVIYNNDEISKLKFVPHTKKNDVESLEETIKAMFERKHALRFESSEVKYIEAFNQIQRVRGRVIKKDTDEKEIEKLEEMLFEIIKEDKHFSKLDKYKLPKIALSKMKLNDADKLAIKNEILKINRYPEVIKLKQGDVSGSREKAMEILETFLAFEQSDEKSGFIYDVNGVPMELNVKQFKSATKKVLSATTKALNETAKLIVSVYKCKTASDVLKIFK